MDVLAAGIASLRRRLSASDRGVPAGPAPRWALVAGGWKLRTPDGVELSLGEAERVFLRMLFEQPGEPVERERLIAGMTESPADFDPHRLEVLLHRLRQRVRGASGHALPLRAVRGIGYLWLHEGG
jgi:DNA-binding response OmpR family regulator